MLQFNWLFRQCVHGYMHEYVLSVCIFFVSVEFLVNDHACVLLACTRLLVVTRLPVNGNNTANRISP